MAAAIETKLYVTNFPSSATRQQLQQFFSRFGRVQECASKIIETLIFKLFFNIFLFSYVEFICICSLCDDGRR
jgi:RNA recognition motif-containing protein